MEKFQCPNTGVLLRYNTRDSQFRDTTGLLASVARNKEQGSQSRDTNKN